MRLSPAAQNRPKSGVRKMMELAWGRPDVVHLEVGRHGAEGVADPRQHVVGDAGIDGAG